jgi:hypothetical protein
MNLTTMNTPVTMTSLELVEFINEIRKPGEAELRHFQLLAKVPQVLGEVGATKFCASYVSAQNKTLPCYRFPKREACLMAMSYSYELQAKVFDRMTALETHAAPSIPTTMVEALTLALETAKKVEAQQAQIAAQSAAITALQPMAVVGERVAQHEHTLEQIVRTFPGVHINKIKAGLLLVACRHLRGPPGRVSAQYAFTYRRPKCVNFV